MSRVGEAQFLSKVAEPMQSRDVAGYISDLLETRSSMLYKTVYLNQFLAIAHTVN